MRHESSSGLEDPDVNYRVTWSPEGGGGETYERIFTGRDHGWDFYLDVKKSTSAYNVTWDHVPA